MKKPRPLSTPLGASSRSESELFRGTPKHTIDVPYFRAVRSTMHLMIGIHPDLTSDIREEPQSF